MADLSITAANVVPVSGSTEYVDKDGIAGEALVPGDLVYVYSTGPNTYKKAQCDVALGAADANLVGMCMTQSGTGQPCIIAKGRITIGSGFTVGQQVNLSATAGKMAPVADLVSTNNVVAAGWIMTGGTDIFLFPKVCSVLRA